MNWSWLSGEKGGPHMDNPNILQTVVVVFLVPYSLQIQMVWINFKMDCCCWSSCLQDVCPSCLQDVCPSGWYGPFTKNIVVIDFPVCKRPAPLDGADHLQKKYCRYRQSGGWPIQMIQSFAKQMLLSLSSWFPDAYLWCSPGSKFSLSELTEN